MGSQQGFLSRDVMLLNFKKINVGNLPNAKDACVN